jgi:hypothetical protein
MSFDLRRLSSIELEIKLSLMEYLQKTKRTPTGFAKEVGIHPLQLIGFIKRGEGLQFRTLKKIGDFINNEKPKKINNY